MHLQELKAKSPADLLAYAEELEIENASTLRKQDMMFAILKQLANNEVAIYAAAFLKSCQMVLVFCARLNQTICRVLMIFMSHQVRYAASVSVLVTRLKVKFAPPKTVSAILPC